MILNNRDVLLLHLTIKLVPNQSLDTRLSSHMQILIICIFTYVNEIVRNEGKLYIKKHTSKLIFASNHHCCMLLNHQRYNLTSSLSNGPASNNHCCIFYIMSDTFDKYFHPVALYEKYLICIFMTINEN